MSDHGIRDRAAIVGIGKTAFAKQLEESEALLACQAIAAAVADAGLTLADVDGLVSLTLESTDDLVISRSLGLGDLRFLAQVPHGGGGGCGSVGLAALAVATGQADVVVTWRSYKRGSRRPWADTGPSREPGMSRFVLPYGGIRPVDHVAISTRRAMHEGGLTRDHLANVALAQRSHAQRNPQARMFGKTMTRDDYMAARWISEPLCLFDNCLETDGAVAVVIVAADRARDCVPAPAYIHAFAQGMPPEYETLSNYWSPEPLRGPSWVAGNALWQHADVKASDIRVAQIYDAFTPWVVASLEAYGFCARGEGGAFTENRNLEYGHGSLAVNTSGGGLSDYYIHGFGHLLEGVQQIRGTSTAQVDDSEFGLVTSAEGGPTSALLLRR